jgi:hypothetical protein
MVLIKRNKFFYAIGGQSGKNNYIEISLGIQVPTSAINK